jgi:hypothetical protein
VRLPAPEKRFLGSAYSVGEESEASNKIYNEIARLTSGLVFGGLEL